MITVLIADDHTAIRTGLRQLIDSSHSAEPASSGLAPISVIAEAPDGQAAIELTSRYSPDVVLMDVRMPRTDGIAATATIVRENQTQVIVLTSFDLDEYVIDALSAGAAGFLVKSAPAQMIRDAIRAVARGDGFLAPEVTRTVLDHWARGGFLQPPASGETTGIPSSNSQEMAPSGSTPGIGEPFPASTSPTAALLDRLTPRESQILQLLTQGLSNSGIAAQLFISETTVKTHVSNVLAKLGASSRLQAAAVYRGIV